MVNYEVERLGLVSASLLLEKGYSSEMSEYLQTSGVSLDEMKDAVESTPDKNMTVDALIGNINGLKEMKAKAEVEESKEVAEEVAPEAPASEEASQ